MLKEGKKEGAVVKARQGHGGKEDGAEVGGGRKGGGMIKQGRMSRIEASVNGLVWVLRSYNKVYVFQQVKN